MTVERSRIIEALQAMYDEYNWDGGDLSILAEDEPDHALVLAMNVLYDLKQEK
jgi:hypothetical protein